MFKEVEELNLQAKKAEEERLTQDDVKLALAIQEQVRLINYLSSNLEEKKLK